MSQNKLTLKCVLLLAGLWGTNAALGAEGPIKVGGTVAMTGEFEAFGQEQSRGLRFWERDINDRGALLGRRVQVVLYDDASETAGVAALYEKLIELGKANVGEARDLSFPHDVVFIDRSLAGHFGNLAKLGATGPWREIVRRYAGKGGT